MITMRGLTGRGLATSVLIAATMAAATAGRAEKAGTDPTYSVTAKMSNGSVVKGTPEFSSVDLVTPYGSLRIPLADLAGIDFSKPDAKSPAVFTLRNKDHISGSMAKKSLQIVSPYGPLVLPVPDIRSLTVALASVPGQPPVGTPSIEGLILYYPFDEDLGEVVEDASGGGRTGQVHGATWESDGARGGAYRFDNNRQSITATDTGLPSGDSPRSIAAWMKLNVEYPDGLTSFLGYGTQGYHSQFTGLGFDWRLNRDQVYFSPGGACFLSERRLPAPGTWIHVAYTYGGNGAHHLYIDGARSDGMSELGGPVNTTPSGLLLLGGDANASGPDGGYLDEVMIFDRELTAEEVGEVYRLATPAIR